jgi:Electron transfer flavoprotein, alpha subunit
MRLLNNVWVFADKTSSLAGLCAGGRQLGEKVTAIVLGAEEEARQAVNWGADQVYWLGPKAADKMLEDYTCTIAALLERHRPELLLINASKRNKVVAGRLAAILGTSVVTDAMQFMISEDIGALEISHIVYGGLAVRIEHPLSDIAIATVGNGVFIAENDSKRQGNIIAAPFVEDNCQLKLLECRVKDTESVDLPSAARVVSVGRGIGKEEGLEMVYELAKHLKAEVACTRPVAEEEKWMSPERYIGVSGAMIKPDMYLALGISGQIQHMTGVNGARVIIAVNKDLTAPIFEQSDYGLVGDLYKVVPALIKNQF